MEFDKQDWIDRGATYRQEFRYHDGYRAQEQALINALSGLYFASILEVGCGFGRLTKILYPVFKVPYVATDVSPGMIESAQDYVGEGPEFDRYDLDDNRVMLAEFDLVLCAEVLMHRAPDVVERDVAILCRAANLYVVTVDCNGVSRRPVVGAQYHHDYVALFGRYGSVNVTQVPEARQDIFVTKVGEEPRHG